MNINQRQRSEKQRDTLQAEWDLRNEKLKQLRLALAIEAGAAVKFQLQQQIQAEETELKRLNDELHTIEQALYTVNLVESPTIEPDPDTPNLVKSPPIDPTPSPPIVVKPPILPKADYHQLRDLLEKKAWQEADQETVQIILQVARRQKEGSLKAKDLKNFSCSDICMIDQLWIEASQGQFGFSVQRNIWFSVDGQPGKFDPPIFRNFGDSVGWRVNGDWLRHYTSLNFSQAAPKGHLPSLRFPHAEGGAYWFGTWQDNFKGFLTLMEDCLSRSS
ncbi:GUN4 domain-containing protein [Nostoc sp. CHAB 5784]|uniref:GUN4 domain-containing protein n=1 Tax=Nostoc mirabile TaxID=2907820 RepID=UPI001E318D1C|nr:GUN4 domain-containing protein [Nostoc mirabile]MCC5668735.1 GUN4 domain-containing protein [Nostoc mirabile CHAB5784]